MTLQADFETAHAHGCIQAGSDVHDNVEDAAPDFKRRYYALMGATQLDPCTTGCPAFNNGQCDAFIELFEDKPDLTPPAEKKETPEERQARIDKAIKPPGTAKYPHLSVKQIANELGISKNEVRRRKVAGTI